MTLIQLQELTTRDIIETLVTYNIEHCRFPHNYAAVAGYDIPLLRGLAMDDKKLILIDKDLTTEYAREIIIHELLHTKHFRLGDLTMKGAERQIIRETNYTYEKIYGVKPR